MRYFVWFKDCPSEVEFDNLKDADHYARLNAGCVQDTEADETVADYSEEWD